MPFPNNLLPPSTWRHIGLTLTTTLSFLGALAILSPTTAASTLGIAPATTPEGRAITRKTMTLLGVRDLAIAASLLWFHREGKQREMGVVITAFTLVCVTDTWVAGAAAAAKTKRWWNSGGVWALGVGTVAVAVDGLGLVQS